MGRVKLMIVLLIATASSRAVSELAPDFRITPLTAEGCGVTRGCYRVPKGCQPDDCNYFLSWVPANDRVAFEYAAKVDDDSPWVAFGINDKRSMGGASVVDCIVLASDHKRVNIQMSYNQGTDNEVLDNRTLGLVNGSLSGTYSDARVRCNFTRVIHIDPSSKERIKVRDLDRSYYVLTAQGHTDADGVKQEHERTPQKSQQKISFLTTANYGATRSPYIIAHASIMIIAWMIFASFGVTTSRYLKPQWTSQALCGKSLWFQIHRFCVITTLCLTLVSMIIIFYASQWQFLPPKIHPLLGFIAACLLVVNPILATFRPEPRDPKRFAFRIVHGGIGHISHLVAVFAMFFGARECDAFMPGWAQWIVTAFCGWRLLADIVLTCIAYQDPVINFVSLSVSSEPAETYDPMFRWRMSVVTVYMSVTVVMAVVLLYAINSPVSLDLCH